jgi:DNA-binding NarL/FixJ family response regulator
MNTPTQIKEPQPRSFTMLVETTEGEALAGRGIQVASVVLPARDAASDDLAVLTTAEREIARGIGAGMSNAEIAQARGTAGRTVANQVASILRKLGLSSRIEIAALLPPAVATKRRTSTRRRATKCDPISVIEQAYRLDLGDHAWLTSMVEMVRPLLDGGLGVHAYFFDTSAPYCEWEPHATAGDATDVLEGWRQITLANSDRELVIAMHVSSPLFASALQNSAALGRPLQGEPAYHQLSHSMVDSVGLRALDPDGRGVCFSGPSPRERPVQSRDRWTWERVAVHISTALRLRRNLQKLNPAMEEAVVRPDGHIDHAIGAATPRNARDMLREAVIARERARRHQVRSRPSAIELWRGLVDGRWSLVDRFDRDGKRFIVACKNPIQVDDPRTLTAAERTVVRLATRGERNKLIAYRLGVAPSTVATLLASGMRKLGCTSRTDLVTTFSWISTPSRRQEKRKRNGSVSR